MERAARLGLVAAIAGIALQVETGFAIAARGRADQRRADASEAVVAHPARAQLAGDRLCAAHGARQGGCVAEESVGAKERDLGRQGCAVDGTVLAVDGQRRTSSVDAGERVVAGAASTPFHVRAPRAIARIATRLR